MIQLSQEYSAIYKKCNYTQEQQQSLETGNYLLEKNEHLIQYIAHFTKIVEKNADGEHVGNLLLRQVNLNEYAPFVHPAVLALNFCLERMEQDVKNKTRYQVPKIAFLNLDGFESIHNVKILKKFRKTLQYISVFEDEMQDVPFGDSSLLRDTDPYFQKA